MTTQTQAAPGRTPETGVRSQIEPPDPFQPAVDIRDSGAAVTLVADVPGARTDGITVAFEEGVLTVEAAVAARQLPGRIVQREYGIGDYRRMFQLGNGFDASQIVAEYRNGVLTIHVPRLAAVRPRKIEVRPA
jgi:HSP20 family molecular chaperone IbpA